MMEKETFRNLIIQSMERIGGDVNSYPISLSEFFVTMSAVIIHQAAKLASPNGSTEPTYKDVLNVMSCYDWAKAALLSMQINRFISWLSEVLESAVEYLKDYEKIKSEQSWTYYPETMGR